MMETRRKTLNWGDGFEWLLILLVLVGVAYRFVGLNWSQGANLHPDEYGLTNTLTQLKLPASVADYFNTRISPLSPYQRYDLGGQKSGDGPDNRMRWGQWPLTLLRAAAELTGNTGYDELRLNGRAFSAFMDVLSLVLLYAIGARLFGRRTGLLAAALSALAVLQIQQAHFMTVDTFATFFAMLAMYAAVHIAQGELVRRSGEARGPYRPVWSMLGWFGLFGAAFGMALASKVNLAPLAGMVVAAALIGVADLKLRTRADLGRIFLTAALFLAASGLAAGISFRLTQPMSFRAPTGNTTLLTMQLNPDWMDSMAVAQGESNGTGVGPPGDQWASRLPILYPLTNMVLWGMGLPLGLAAWAAFLAALWQWLRYGRGWRSQLLPLIWTGGYFLFMGTRWVMSVRYFLPIYPFLCLFAAWGLLALWRRFDAPAGEPRFDAPVIERRSPKGRIYRMETPLVARQKHTPAARRGWQAAAGILLALVLLGTLAWATAFSKAVYWTDHTRLQATRWIFANVPGPIQLTLRSGDGQIRSEPVGLSDGLRLSAETPLIQPFRVSAAGVLTAVMLPHAAGLNGATRLHLAVKADPADQVTLGETDLVVPESLGGAGAAVQADLTSAPLEKGILYYLVFSVPAGETDVRISRVVVSDESWDEALPVPLDERDPFGQLYRGVIMQVRWPDNADKRQMYLDTLNEVDYIFVPSQRAVWATCRLPKTYPMTMAYYRALFAGQLGFEQVAAFSAPLRLGPLVVSDLAGSAAWGRLPDLPVLNHNPLAVEEAFSVYDHPPVWIFRKRADFDLAAVQHVLDSVDLSQVVVESPLNPSGPPCP